MSSQPDKSQVNKDIKDYEESLGIPEGGFDEIPIPQYSTKKEYQQGQARRSQAAFSIEKNEPVGGRFETSSKYDVNIDPVLDPVTGMTMRAEFQPWQDQFANMWTQGFVAEGLAGTFMSIGALLDPQSTSNALTGTEEAFTNAIYEWGQSLYDETKEEFPIYTNPYKRFSDPGYWFQGVESAMSATSSLVTGLAVGAAVTVATEGMGAPAAVANILSTLGGSLAMRHAENYREAHDVFKTQFEKARNSYIESGMSEEMATIKARDLASQAAAKDYKMNYANLVFDVVQLGSVMKAGSAFKAFTRDLGVIPGAISEAAGITAKRSAVKKVGYWMAENVLPQSTEAVEEGINSISQHEAERFTDIELGKQEDDGSNILERISGYLKLPDVQDSMLWGFVGGVMFGGIGSAFHKDRRSEARLEELKTRPFRLQKYLSQISEIKGGKQVKDEKGETIRDYSTLSDEQKSDAAENVLSAMRMDLGISAATVGNTEVLLKQMDLPQFKKDAIALGWATEEDFDTEKAKLKEAVLKAEDVVQRANFTFNLGTSQNKIQRLLAKKYTSLDAEREMAVQSSKRYGEKFEQYKAQDTFLNTRELNGVPIENLSGKIDLASYYLLKNAIQHEKIKADKNNDVVALDRLKETEKIVEQKISELKNKKIDTTEILDKVDKRMFYSRMNQMVNDIQVELYTEEMANMSRKETQDEYIKQQTEKEVNQAAEYATRMNKKKQEEKDGNPLTVEQILEWEQDKRKALSPETLEIMADLVSRNVPLRGKIAAIYKSKQKAIDKRVEQIKAELLVKTEAKKEGEKETPIYTDRDWSIDEGIGDELEGFGAPTDIKIDSEGRPTDQRGFLARNTGNKLGYRAVEKDRVGITTTFSSVLLEPLLMHHSSYQPGTTLSVKVANSEILQKYGFSENQVKELRQKVKNNTLTEADKELIFRLPIGIYNANGKHIAFLHDATFIKEYTASTDTEGLGTEDYNKKVKEELDKNFATRLQVLSEGIFNTYVTLKSHGSLLKNTDEEGQYIYQQASNAFNSALPIVIVKDGQFLLDKNKPWKANKKAGRTEIMNNPNNLKNGQPYVVVPSANGTSFALPLERRQLNKKHIPTIMRILEAYYKLKISTNPNDNKDKTIDQFEKNLAKVLDRRDLDLSNIDHVREILQQYYNVDFADEKKLHEDRQRWLDNKLDHNESGNTVRLQIGNGEISMYRVKDILTPKFGILEPTVRIGRGFSWKEQAALLEELLSDMYINADVTKLNKPMSMPVVAENGIGVTQDPSIKSYNDFILQNSVTNISGIPVKTPQGKEEKVYFVHPVILFNTEKETKEQEKNIEQQLAETKVEDKNIFDPNANTFFAPVQFEEPLLSQKEIDEIRSSADKYLIKGKGWTTFRQRIVTDHISVSVLEQLQNKLGKRLDISKSYNRVKNNLERLNNERKELGLPTIYDEILEENNWNNFVKKSLQDLITSKIVTIYNKNGKRIKSLEQLEEGDTVTDILNPKYLQDGSSEVQVERDDLKGKRFNDVSVFQLRPQKAVYGKLKLLLGYVEDATGLEQDPRTAAYGFNAYKNYDEVVHTILNTLVEVEPTTDAMMAALEDEAENTPWLQTVVDKLQGKDLDPTLPENKRIKALAELDQLKRQMVSLCKHDTQYVMLHPKERERYDPMSDEIEVHYNTMLINPIKNTLPNQIKSNWLNNFLRTGLVVQDEQGTLTITDTVRKDLVDFFNEVKALQKKYTNKGNPDLNKALNEIQTKFTPEVFGSEKAASFIYNKYLDWIRLGKSSDMYTENKLSKDLNYLVFSGILSIEERNALIKTDTKAFKESLSSLHATIDAENISTNLRLYLETLGIKLNDRAFYALISGKMRVKGSPQNLVALLSDRGPIGLLNRRLALESTDILEDERVSSDLSKYNPFTDNSGINSLARLQARYDNTVGKDSMRNIAGNLIQQKTMHRNLSLEMQRLRNSKTEEGMLTTDATNLCNSDFVHTDLTAATLDYSKSNCKMLVDIITDDEYSQDFEIKWMDGSRNGVLNKEPVEISTMGPRELEIAKIQAYHNAQKDAYGYVFFPSSERNVVPMLPIKRMEAYQRRGRNGEKPKLNRTAMDALVGLFKADAMRINAAAEQKADKNHVIHNYDNYKKGSGLFYLMPQFNNKDFVPGLWDASGTVVMYNDPNVIEAVEEKINEMIENLVADKLRIWKENEIIDSDGNIRFIDDSYKQKLKKVLPANYTKEQLAQAIARDYVVNQFVANGNMIQMFAGDPAFYYTSKAEKALNKEGVDQAIKLVWDNFSKRISRNTAPKTDIADGKYESTTMLKISDFTGPVNPADLKIIEKVLSKEDAAKYQTTNHTDASEVLTMIERLIVKYKEGEIDKDKFDTLKDKILNNKKITNEEAGTLFNPAKYVYSGFVWNGDLNANVPVYIKSSELVLCPEFTKGTENDKLRKVMEGRNEDNSFAEHAKDVEGNYISRLAHESAVKVDASKPSKVYKEDGSIDVATTEQPVILSKKDLGKQQEVPYSEVENLISRGSQADTNILEYLSASLMFTIKGRLLNGEQLRAAYEEAYVELYKIHADAFLEEVGYNPLTGQVDIKKLQKRLEEEVLSEGYPAEAKNVIKLVLDELGNPQFEIPLWFTGFSTKFQNALTAIVSNSITRLDFPGFSATLEPNTGFKTIRPLSELKPDEVNDIVYLPGFEGAEQLKDDEMLVPSKFEVEGGQINLLERDKDGKYVWITEDANGVKRLNLEKFDEDLLKLFSYRIPNAGKNMMASAKIVGFLPQRAGDMVVASSTFITRMGSDFDIDKLYSYMYNHKLEKGKFVRDESTRQKRLENELLDYRWAIMDNPSDIIQKAKYQPLDEGRVINMAKELELLNKNIVEEASANYTKNYLYDQTQSEVYLKGRASDVAIGAFASLKKLNAMAQGKGIIFTENGIASSLIFGDANGATSSENGNKKYAMLGREKTHALERVENGKVVAVEEADTLEISTVQSGLLSTALDTFKTGLMGSVGITVNNLSVFAAITSHGYDVDYAVMLANQPIVKEYIDMITKNSDSYATKGRFKAATEAKEFLLNKYWKESGEEGDYDPVIDREAAEATGAYKLKYEDYPIRLRDMYAMLTDNRYKSDRGFNYGKLQIVALEKYLKAEKHGKELMGLMRLVNTDSAHIPSNLFQAHDKWTRLQKIHNSPSFAGAERLLGVMVENEDGSKTLVPKTIAGAASYYGLKVAVDLWSPFFLYNKPFFSSLLNEVVKQSGKLNKELSDRDYIKIERFIKTYINSTGLGLFTGTATENRQALFFDNSFVNENSVRIYNKKSIGTRVLEAKELDSLADNVFIQNLKAITDVTGKTPSRILFNKGNDTNVDIFVEQVRKGFADLFGDNTIIADDYTVHNLAEDLVKASFLAGDISGYTDYLEYIPHKYLIAKKVAENVRNIDLYEGWLTDPKELERMLDAYYDHFPEEATIIKLPLKTKAIEPIGTKGVKDIPPFFTLNREEALKQGLLKRVKDENDNEVDEAIARITLQNNKVYAPYKYIGVQVVLDDFGNPKTYEHVYQRRDRKGYEGWMELDATTDANLPSSIYRNQTGLHPYTFEDAVFGRILADKRKPKEFKYDVKGTEALNNLGLPRKGDKNSVVKVLRDLKHDARYEEQRVVAEVLEAAFLNSNTPLSFTREGDKVQWSTDNVLALPDKAVKEYTLNNVINNLLHEGMHAVTANTIMKYFNDPSSLSKQESFAVQSLISLHSSLYDKIQNDQIKIKGEESSKEALKWYVEKTKALEKIKETGISVSSILSGQEVDRYNKLQQVLYAFREKPSYVNISEFVAEVFSNNEFRTLLNETEYRSDKSAFQQFFDQIIKIFKAITKAFNIKEDSMLEEGVRNILLLTDLKPPSQPQTMSEEDYYAKEADDPRYWGREEPDEMPDSTRDFGYVDDEMFDIDSLLDEAGSMEAPIQFQISDIEEGERLMKECKGFSNLK